MKLNFCNWFTKSAARTAAALPMLIIAGAFFTPQNSSAQSQSQYGYVPPVSSPKMVGFRCPSCNGDIKTPSGKHPAACPHCGISFAQRTKPAPAKNPGPSAGCVYCGIPLRLGTRGLDHKPSCRYSMPAPAKHDDKPYYDDPAATDGLQPRDVDPHGLAEALAKIWELNRKNKESQIQELENDKISLLNGTASQKLKNPFADNDPNVVDLRQLGDSAGTPKLLRVADPKQPSEYDFPKDVTAAKAPEASEDDLVLGSKLARAVATRGATVTLKPYQQEEVEKITAENGWVIAARDLDSWVGKTGVNLTTRRDDNPYGMHWQILLPNGENVGYTAGTRIEDGKVLPNFKSDSNTQYKGIVASGKNGAVMREAVQNVKARWEEKYITDPEGQAYNAGSHNCQDFTGDVLKEYQRLLSTQH